ncbi:MAG: glycosyltransferase [Cytophagales bacterium]|nr:glycosyltransferase [Cytophagaceae bacterium]MDW8206041.1 glycosyltransferase [Cytophagales bacterium]MDW8457375.1 glycosyltransferase [Cytophagaceae bacterium]
MKTEPNTPTVSVLMCVFNGEKYLKEAMDSILCQTFTDFEFIIIDDNSTDRSVDMIRSYTDRRIRLFRNEENIGLTKSLNKGIELARGKYIARMDADDISLPDRLAVQVQFMEENPQVSLVATHIALIDTEGAIKGYWQDDIDTTTHEKIVNRLPHSNCIAHPSIVIRSEILKRYRYNEECTNSQDWELWLRLSTTGHTFAKITEVKLHYRIHHNSISCTSSANGVNKKIERLYFIFIKNQLRNKNFSLTLLKVLIKYLKLFINRKKIEASNWVYQWRIKFFLWRQLRKHDIILFFPFYHLGGAERVHADITKTISAYQPLVLFTSYSKDTTFKKQFEQSANTIELDYVIHSMGEKNMLRFIASCINRKKKKQILFGANSKLFYDILPYISDPQIIKIDLIHAFHHPHEWGYEKYSLPHVSALNQRIVINQKTFEDMQEQYENNNITPELKKRILLVHNQVAIPNDLPAKSSDKMIVLYSGQDSHEKRAHIVENIAKRMYELGIQDVEFHIAGYLKENISPNLKFWGIVTDEHQLNSLYKKSHAILITSSREGFPMSLLEGMAHGAIPISTKVGGIPYYITDGLTGFLIDNVEDENLIVEQFIEKILKIARKPAMREEMSLHAYQYVVQNFHPDIFSNNYRALFNINA